MITMSYTPAVPFRERCTWTYLMFNGNLSLYTETRSPLFLDPVKTLLNFRIFLLPLKQSVLALKLEICQSFMDRIDDIGHIICPGRLGTAWHTTAATLGLISAKPVNELRSFPGLCILNAILISILARMASLIEKIFEGDLAQCHEILLEKTTHWGNYKRYEYHH